VRVKLLQRRLQRADASIAALGAAETPQGIGDSIGKDLAQPACKFRVRLASKLAVFAIRLKECILNDVGGVEARGLFAERAPGEDDQVRTKSLQAGRWPPVFIGHDDASEALAAIGVTFGRWQMRKSCERRP
jgi:hypothetical protein